MTPRTFWNMFIKIIGIWILLDWLKFILQFLSTIFLFSTSDSGVITAFSLLSILLMIYFYIILLRYCFIKTDWVIDKLHLDKGFTEDKLDFNIHRSTILSIATIVIGGLMFVNNIPELFKQVYGFFQDENLREIENPATIWIIRPFVYVFLGYFLMTNSRLVVNFIERKRDKTLRDKE